MRWLNEFMEKDAKAYIRRSVELEYCFYQGSILEALVCESGYQSSGNLEQSISQKNEVIYNLLDKSNPADLPEPLASLLEALSIYVKTSFAKNQREIIRANGRLAALCQRCLETKTAKEEDLAIFHSDLILRTFSTDDVEFRVERGMREILSFISARQNWSSGTSLKSREYHLESLKRLKNIKDDLLPTNLALRSHYSSVLRYLKPNCTEKEIRRITALAYCYHKSTLHFLQPLVERELRKFGAPSAERARILREVYSIGSRHPSNLWLTHIRSGLLLFGALVDHLTYCNKACASTGSDSKK